MIRLTILLSILVLPLSCKRDSTTGPQEGGTPVRLALGQSPDTKLSGMDYALHEEAVSHWAFFIFERSTGLLAYSGVVGSEGAVTKTLRTGAYELFVMANYPLTGSYAPSVSAIRTTADFLRLKTSLANNAPGSFVMAGAAGFMVPGGGEVMDVQVRLQRLAVKVHLGSVLRRFDNASLGARAMTLRHAYLTNVCPESRYAEDYSASELPSLQSGWYNAMGWHHPSAMGASSAIDALVGERDLDIPLRQNINEQVDRSLYCYPNPWDPEADSHEALWDAGRCTRLVLETELGGLTYYYQATLPALSNPVPLTRNRAFSMSCTLTRLGSRDPEEEVPGAMLVQISALPQAWDTDYTITEES